MATKRKLIPFSEGRTTGDNPYETGYRVGRAFSARNMRASRRSDQYNKARQEERYTGKSPGKPPPAPIHRAMAGYKAIDRIRDRTVDRYQRHTQNPRRGPMTRAIQGRQTRRDYDKGVEDARHNYRQSRGSIETGEGPGGKDYIPDRVGAGDISTGDLGKKIRFSMNRRSRRNPPEWSYRDKDIAMDKLKGFMDADDEGEEWKKGKNNEAMENSNMKYSHDNNPQRKLVRVEGKIGDIAKRVGRKVAIPAALAAASTTACAPGTPGCQTVGPMKHSAQPARGEPKILSPAHEADIKRRVAGVKSRNAERKRHEDALQGVSNLNQRMGKIIQGGPKRMETSKELIKKDKTGAKREDSSMKYNHDKILAESASLTLSDLEQLQSAPGPVTERQKYGGNKGDIPDADREKKGHFGRGPKTRETAKEEGEIDFKNGNGLSGKQEDVMDTDKDGDIDAKDLKNLRGKKKGKKRQKYGGNKGDIPDADRKKKGRFGRGPKTRATAKEEGEIDFSHKRTLGDILSERRRGKPGTPKGEEHARDTEERTEIRQKHEDEVASSDGGPYVARDIKVGSYQPPIYGSGGSRRPKKKPGHKGDERRLSRLARHRRSLKKKK